MGVTETTRTTQEILNALAEPFEVADVEWRIDGKSVDGDNGTKRARCVCYVKARAVMDRLDAVLPPFAWNTDYRVLPDGKHVECTLTIEIDGRAVTRRDVGETNEGGFADGMKSAYSDALKRAGVQFGIGRYMGRITAQWADVQARGKNEYITDRALAGLERSYCEQTGVKNGAEAKPPRPDAEVAQAAQGARQAAKGDRASAGDISVWWGHVSKLGFTREQAQAVLNERKLVLAGLTRTELNDLYRQLVELSKKPAETAA